LVLKSEPRSFVRLLKKGGWFVVIFNNIFSAKNLFLLHFHLPLIYL
jgi:hypothetical protein